MGVLTEYVRNEAEQLKTELHRREGAVKEWKSAIQQLYQQLVSWVSEADGGHQLLHTDDARLQFVREPRLGGYQINCLRIALGSREVEVVPRARHVVATIKPPGKEPRRADGMVQIRGGSMADYYLFRLKEEDGDHWYIQSVARWNADPNDIGVEGLDRDRFEAAILHILK